MPRPAPPEIASLEERLYNAEVVEVKECAPRLRILGIRPDAGPISWTPGQYLGLGLGTWTPRADGVESEEPAPEQDRELMIRHYSFSHPILDARRSGLVPPGGMDGYEFYVAMPEYGDEDRTIRFTPRLFSLSEGDRLYVEGEASGEYTAAPVSPGDDVVFISTGTGEAPHNALIWHLMTRGHEGRIASIVSTRFEKEQGYREIHRALEKLRPGYRYLTLVTRESGAGCRKGRVQDYFENGDLERDLGWRMEPGRARVFLCGNPAMIGVPRRRPGSRTYPEPRGMIELLERRGFNADDRSGRAIDVHYERFW